ncbi:MAG: benzylsuccinate CoA-transferase BbsF subunit [Acidimicrobiales bacterium]|jgi:benzylsuccinate CoA-transferase BbsF subunit
MTDGTEDGGGDLQALTGLKVFELGIAIASPFVGRNLAAHGADVFKIESPTSPDIVRLIGSAWMRDNEELAPAVADSSPYISEMNADKKSVALDLKQSKGLAAARLLLAECDVFIANFAARALTELGFDYESVRAINPNIVYVQLPGFGSDPESPYYRYVAWGPNQAPLVGLDELTGHAGREPAGIATVAPPDYFAAQHATFLVLAGLEQRDRTGEGVYVDISQFEATIAMLGPFAMDYTLSGKGQSRIGNRSLWYAPEGVYPCHGHERWIAISCEDDEQWGALDALASRGWAADERFATNESRMTNIDQLDEALADWTAGFANEDLACRLQAGGVPAHIVATNEDLIGDSQLRERGAFLVRPNSRFKREMFTSNMQRLTDTPPSNARGGPSTGEHTVEVLTKVAGMSEAEVQALVDENVAFTMEAPDLRLERPSEEWLHILFPLEAEDSRDLA